MVSIRKLDNDLDEFLSEFQNQLSDDEATSVLSVLEILKDFDD